MASFLDFSQLANLRACINCSRLKSFDEFYREGCENCEKYLKFKNNPERIILCSTLNFEGIMTLSNNDVVWTTRIRKVDSIRIGVYALYVFGNIPPRVLHEILVCPD